MQSASPWWRGILPVWRDFILAGPRQFHRARDNLLRRLFRHRHEREELIVYRSPEDVARPGAILQTWLLGSHPQASQKRSVVEPGWADLLFGRAVIPHQANALAIVLRPHGRGRPNRPLLGGHAHRLTGCVLQTHRCDHEVIGAGLKFFDEAEAVRERLLGTHSGFRFRQGKNAVTLHRIISQYR